MIEASELNGLRLPRGVSYGDVAVAIVCAAGIDHFKTATGVEAENPNVPVIAIFDPAVDISGSVITGEPHVAISPVRLMVHAFGDGRQYPAGLTGTFTVRVNAPVTPAHVEQAMGVLSTQRPRTVMGRFRDFLRSR